MSETMMMDAVADIHDRYVLEFADVQPVAKVGLMRWMLPAAACLCLVLGALALRFVDGPKEPPALELPPVAGSTQSQMPTTPAPTGATIWGNAAHFGGVGTVGGGNELEMGKVEVCYCLLETMETSENAADVYAVRLTEGSGVEKDVIYKTVVQPLGVDEDFLENNVVFLTREQIEHFKCPNNMSILLCIHGKDPMLLSKGGAVLVGEDYFSSFGEEKIVLWIYFSAGNHDDCGARGYGACSCEFDSIVNSFLAEYNLTEATWVYELHLDCHTGYLKDVDPDLVYPLLSDPRICYVWYEGEGGHCGAL